MADFVRFAKAAETVLGFSGGAVADSMHQRQLEAQLRNLDVDPVVPRIIRWFKDADEVPKVDKIEGTATEIIELLTPTKDKPSNWPKTSNQFSQHLPRNAPDLRSAGVIIEKNQRVANRRPITIKKLMGI